MLTNMPPMQRWSVGAILYVEAYENQPWNATERHHLAVIKEYRAQAGANEATMDEEARFMTRNHCLCLPRKCCGRNNREGTNEESP